MAWFVLVCFISLFKKIAGKILAGKNSRGKNLAGKNRRGKDLQ